MDEAVRRAAFALLIRDGRPVSLASLAQALPEPADERAVAAAAERLARAGLVDQDASGAIIGAGGLTLAPGSHRLLLGGREFSTWCAYDAIGIPAALGIEGSVSTRCPVCGRPIALRLPAASHQERPERPERLWLAAGGANMRADFCAPTVLLCLSEHAEAWATQHAGRGRILELGQAWRLGAGAWGLYAAEVERLAGPVAGR